MHREYHKWHSDHLGREMEMLIFGTGGRAVLLFPTRMARFYDYENWGIIHTLSSQIERGEIQLFCVDSIDGESFYNTSVFPSVRIDRHLQYEAYLLNEVIPLIYQKNNGNWLESVGFSMGAYHAVNIAMKHPHLFSKTVGISGRYDLTHRIHPFHDLMNGFRSDLVYHNMPIQFLPQLKDNKQLDSIHAMEIILVVGEADPFLEGNKSLSHLLWEKGINNQFYIWEEEAHRPYYWRKMAPLYI